jgi:hypothetical protein
MTTLVRHSPGLTTADRGGHCGVRREAVITAEARSTSAADRLHQETGLLVSAAKKLRERGLAGDAELAQLLERSMLSLWAGASGAESQLLSILAVVQATT